MVLAIGEDYPILEYLAILDWAEDISISKHFKYHMYATSRWLASLFR